MQKNYMFTPGPTMVPSEVRLAEAQEMIHHRTPRFSEIMQDVMKGMQKLLGTKQNVYFIGGSGTAAMEAAIANTCSPGDKAICARGGKFGARWGEICETYGCEVEGIDLEWGESLSIDKARKALDANPDAKVLCVTHSETSTGALTDVETLGSLTCERDTLLVVDGITSVGVHPVEMDHWGIDVLAVGSQKGCMVPPGLAFIAASDKAWKVIEDNDSPRYYLDMEKMRSKWESSCQTPFTGIVSLVRALKKAVEMMEDEGLKNVYKRHAELAEASRTAMKAIGLELIPDNPANGVTAVKAPEGIDTNDLAKLLRDEYGVTIAGGQAQFKGKIFRIGHMGYVSKEDLLICISSIERGLRKLGYDFEFGAGVSAAQECLFG
ncbi:class V aminotransferase [candidate division MSBL1 archaeon SCGC-AAA382A20]|uniref:Class V aminotransferase n=1 Tax=candidate division MSBL1 archaeon SCGC-AAA382A20 TaxID=1698280 RepID=A0A133VMC2_9EURY|nr:class V aminotransferase [candidate division MSBL1 archaeon SCGC-AAA382A20]